MPAVPYSCTWARFSRLGSLRPTFPIGLDRLGTERRPSEGVDGLRRPPLSTCAIGLRRRCPAERARVLSLFLGPPGPTAEVEADLVARGHVGPSRRWVAVTDLIRSMSPKRMPSKGLESPCFRGYTASKEAAGVYGRKAMWVMVGCQSLQNIQPLLCSACFGRLSTTPNYLYDRILHIICSMLI